MLRIWLKRHRVGYVFICFGKLFGLHLFVCFGTEMLLFKLLYLQAFVIITLIAYFIVWLFKLLQSSSFTPLRTMKNCVHRLCAVATQPFNLQTIHCAVGERAHQPMWSPSGPQAVTMDFFFHCPWTCWEASAVPRSPPLSPSRWEHPTRDPQHHLAFGPARC